MIRPIMILPLAALLGGCPGGSLEQADNLQRVTIISDSVCRLKRRTWDVGDTPETVAEVRAFNKTWDTKCARRAPTS